MNNKLAAGAIVLSSLVAAAFGHHVGHKSGVESQQGSKVNLVRLQSEDVRLSNGTVRVDLIRNDGTVKPCTTENMGYDKPGCVLDLFPGSDVYQQADGTSPSYTPEGRYISTIAAWNR